LYLKYIAIIFFALQIFYVGIDFLGANAKLPDSANLKFLYSVFIFGASMKISIPLCLVFAIIATKIHLIRANELIILYSLGATKKEVIKPFLKVSVTITFVYVLLFLTPFAYSEQKALSIKHNSYFTSITNNVFIKYNDYYIYMKQLFPFQKVAIDLIVFELKNNNLNRVIKSYSASFQNNKWQLNEGNIVTLAEVKDINSNGLKTSTFKTYSL